MTVVQRLLDVAYILKYKIWRHLKRKEVVDTQSRKVTDKIVASVFTKNNGHAHDVYSEYVIIRNFW